MWSEVLKQVAYATRPRPRLWMVGKFEATTLVKLFHFWTVISLYDQLLDGCWMLIQMVDEWSVSRFSIHNISSNIYGFTLVQTICGQVTENKIAFWLYIHARLRSAWIFIQLQYFLKSNYTNCCHWSTHKPRWSIDMLRKTAPVSQAQSSPVWITSTLIVQG